MIKNENYWRRGATHPTTESLKLFKPAAVSGNRAFNKFQCVGENKMRNVLALLLATWPAFSYGQQFSVDRTWSDSSGKFSVVAGLVDFNSDSVKLQKQNGKAIVIPRSRLSENDIEFVACVESIKQTDAQAKLIAPHVEHLLERPASTVEIIDALRSQFPHAIGGHMLGGFIHAQAVGDETGTKRSQKCFDDAIAILNSIEKCFPGLHRRTLASALNNRGVLALRQGNLLSGINYFVRAADVTDSKISVAVYHNASMLLNSDADLSGGRDRLARVLATGIPEATVVIPDYLMYSLDHDPYITGKESTGDTTSADGTGSKKEIKATDETTSPGKFLVGYGSGLLIAPTLILTNRHVADGHSGFRIRNDSGLSITASTLKVSTSNDIDLAVLEAAQPIDAQPLPIRPSLPRVGESFVVLGYPIPEILEASLTASGGIVSKLINDDLQVLHDASTDPGNSGGPCIDDKGNVIGVHFAGSLISKNNRNFAISPAAINPFLKGILGYSALENRTDSLDFATVIAKNKDAVFMIECYSDERESTPQTANPEETNLFVKYSIFPDRTCLSCFGSGFFDCAACTNGYVSTTKSVQLGVNALTKQPIMGNKRFKTRCSRCKMGKLSCSACSGSGRKN